MPYLLYAVVAPGVSWQILIQTALSAPSYLRLSGEDPMGYSGPNFPIWPTLSSFLRKVRSILIASLFYLAYRFLSPSIWRGIPWVETTDCQRRPRRKRRYPTRGYPSRTYSTLSPTGAIYHTRTYHTYPSPIRLAPSTSQLEGRPGDDTR